MSYRYAFAYKDANKSLGEYNSLNATLSYGNMTYVDNNSNKEVILSVHGIFGGYDQTFDTCRDIAALANFIK